MKEEVAVFKVFRSTDPMVGFTSNLFMDRADPHIDLMVANCLRIDGTILGVRSCMASAADAKQAILDFVGDRRRLVQTDVWELCIANGLIERPAGWSYPTNKSGVAGWRSPFEVGCAEPVIAIGEKHVQERPRQEAAQSVTQAIVRGIDRSGDNPRRRTLSR